MSDKLSEWALKNELDKSGAWVALARAAASLSCWVEEELEISNSKTEDVNAELSQLERLGAIKVSVLIEPVEPMSDRFQS